MGKKRKGTTNGAAWTKAEINVVKQAIEESTSTREGCKKASTMLGRSVGACEFQYYNKIRNKKINKSPKPVENSKEIKIFGRELSFKIKEIRIEGDLLKIKI